MPRLRRPLAIALTWSTCRAKQEYEAWFLAAADSVAGQRGLSETATAPEAPESVGSPKKWLNDHMPSQSCRETLEQPALTAVFDLDAARRAPSLDKMWRDVVSLL